MGDKKGKKDKAKEVRQKEARQAKKNEPDTASAPLKG